MIKRVPDIFFYNPTCEYAIANGSPSWQPNKLLQKMESNMATLPMFFAEQNDFVLVDRIPSESFLENFCMLGLSVPDFITKEDAFSQTDFLNIPKGKLCPWGWSPSVHRLLHVFKNSCSAEFQNSPVFNWKPELKDFYSRRFSMSVLESFISEYHSEITIPKGLTGEICYRIDQLEMLLGKWGKLMVKTPLSSSGRGLQPVTITPVHPKVWEKVLGIIGEQGFVVAEPLLNKVADMAFEFEMKDKKIEFVGFSHFITDKNGRYLGNYLNGMPEEYNDQLKYFIESASNKIVPQLISILQKTQLSSYYEGFFGVDTLIFSDETGCLKINPCLEINLRRNMGLLALTLNTLIDEGKKAIFSTFYSLESNFQ